MTGNGQKNMTIENFDSHQFHDNLLHGLSISVEGYKSELRLDLDYIAEWPACSMQQDSAFEFGVAKGLVTFHDVTDLSVKIEWGPSGYSAAVAGPYIDVLEREEIATTIRLPFYYRWKVVFTDQRSTITFGASSMSFETLGDILKKDRQYLLDDERGGAGPGGAGPSPAIGHL